MTGLMVKLGCEMCRRLSLELMQTSMVQTEPRVDRAEWVEMVVKLCREGREDSVSRPW